MIDVKLYKGDCLTEMDKIADGSIDAIICDPPYGTTDCKWDSVIPFDEMWKQLNRVIKPNGAIVLFGSEPFSSALRMSNIDNYKYDWVWCKTKASNHVNAKNRPMGKHENVSIFSLGTIANGSDRRMEYNPQGLKEVNRRNYRPSPRFGGYQGARPSHQKTLFQKYENYPNTILNFSNPNNKTVHPTQKPVALMEYLVKTYTNKGETVLDFTMGSGSTGVACANTDRNFIGIEQDDKYFNIATKRINEARNKLRLF